MDQQQHVNRIREQGFTVMQNVLSARQIEDTKTALAPWLQKQLMGRNNFEGHHSERVYALLDKAPVIAGLVEHDDVLGIIGHFLEPHYLLSANLAINVHPGETPQPFHADHIQVNNTERSATNGISAIWALDDFTATNGATEVIPGSHLWDRNHAVDEKMVQQVLMPSGSVLVFHGSLVHRGGANRSSTSRLAITPQYCQPWLRQLENMVLAVRPEMARQYSERLQGMLGYSVREPGFMGYVDGLHPRRMIDQKFKGRHARGLRS